MFAFFLLFTFNFLSLFTPSFASSSSSSFANQRPEIKMFVQRKRIAYLVG